jgi:hypothetical protein
VSGGKAAHLQDLSQREAQHRLSKEELLTPRLTQREVEITGLGGVVLIRSLSHARRQQLRQEAHFGQPEWDEEVFTNLTIIHSIVEPKLEVSDIAALREQDASVYDELVLQISWLNMLGRTEELKKDSEVMSNSDSA